MQSFAPEWPTLSPDSFLVWAREVTSRAEQIWEFILYSSLFLGCAAAGMAYSSCFIEGIPFTIPIALILSLVVFSVYNMNRKTDEAEDALNHEKRYRVTKRFENHLFTAAIVAYGLAIAIAIPYGAPAVILAIIPLLSGIVYSVPILPKTWKYQRIKEIPVTKNLVVAGAWATSFSLLPIYMNNLTPGITSIVVFLFIFSWTFIGSVLPDIRDRIGDAATGMETLPVRIGVKKSRYLLTGMNVFFGTAIFFLGSSILSLESSIVLICSFAYSQVCIECIDRTQYNDLLCDVISDGQFLTIAALCVLIVPLLISIGITGSP